ncbi:MAG TPA: energy-coupling factor ABC transporter permease [Gemmatales bacterium]|nr:energy-coupling factor ABC transporter permease [Gemmatales bacterium]HMP58589.1 energy-coupling factor ABC transporter permease [Gemmatales bacterium]
MNALLAVHLSDGILSLPACAVGGAILLVMVILGGWRLRDDEIPRLAVMAAAFLVASLIRIHVPGGSVHLLLNGLVGVLVGRRAAVAIPLALLLQAILFQHGGLAVLGVNGVVMVLPAWLAALGFALGRRHGWWRRPWLRAVGGFVLGSGAVLLTASGYLAALALGGMAAGELTGVGMVVFVGHLPLAVIEGLFTVVVLAALWRARPEMFVPPAAPA